MSEEPSKPSKPYDARMASEMADRDDDAILRGIGGVDRYAGIVLPDDKEEPKSDKK